MTKIYDVTRTVTSGMDVYPGDPEVRIASVADASEGDPYTVSALAMGSHTGTHVDAPLHLFPDGIGVDGISPDNLIGPVAVVDTNGSISIDREQLVASVPPDGCERLLLRTRPKGRDGAHAFLTPEAAHWLVPYSVEAELTVTSNGGRSSWDGVHRFSVTREPERTVNSSDASRHRDRHIAELMREVMRQLERRASFRRE